jgi:RNA polymerase sigma factor (sigma-70 family)
MVISAEVHLTAAIEGDRVARAALVRSLAPIVQVRVYRALCVRGGAARGRAIRQEVEDISQDALVALFENDAHVLRGWDAARGLSFLNYVGLVTERLVGHLLRDRRRSPWTADPTEDVALERAAGATLDHEEHVASRQTLDRVWATLKRELTPRGWELFRHLVVEERTVEEACERFGMRPDAVYAWRSRFTKRSRALLEEIDGTTSDAPARRAIPLTVEDAP